MLLWGTYLEWHRDLDQDTNEMMSMKVFDKVECAKCHVPYFCKNLAQYTKLDNMKHYRLEILGNLSSGVLLSQQLIQLLSSFDLQVPEFT